MLLRQVTLYYTVLITLGSQDICNKDNSIESSNCPHTETQELSSSLTSWATNTLELPGVKYSGSTVTSDREIVRCPPTPPYTCSWGDCTSPVEGQGSVALSDLSVMTGKWREGLIEGQGNITYPDKSVLTGHFLHGCLHGVVTLQEEDGGVLVGHYLHGHLGGGPTWLLYPGGEGGLYVHLGDSPQVGSLSRAVFTGDHVSWVYPDYTTALVGQFVGGTMLGARQAVVTGVKFEHGVPRLELVAVDMDQEVYKFDPSTVTHLSATPLQRDPYERKMVDVKTSRITGAGVGVFTNKFVRNNTIIGYFNGVHMHRGEVFKHTEKSAYLVEGTHPNEMLDIPEEFQSWDKYRGSAGHLINHDHQGNVDYTECWHPRFGKILCVVSVQDIQADTELLVKYDVAVDGEGLKFALKTALHLGHVVSGKSKDQFARDVKPYLKLVSDIVKNVKMSDLIKF